jgi:hypothetical protein
MAKVKGEHIVTVKLLKTKHDQLTTYSKSLSSMVQDTVSLFTKLSQIEISKELQRDIDSCI